MEGACTCWWAGTVVAEVLGHLMREEEGAGSRWDLGTSLPSVGIRHTVM